MTTADQKKIFILGGTKHMIEAVRDARKMGMSPIVVEDIIGALAKYFADKSFNINVADTDKLAEIAKKEKVVGVYNAFNATDTWHAISLCKKAKLPFYMAKEHFSFMTEKEKFEDICRRFEVTIIEQCDNIVEFRQNDLPIWEFPLNVNLSKNNLERWKNPIQYESV